MSWVLVMRGGAPVTAVGGPHDAGGGARRGAGARNGGARPQVTVDAARLEATIGTLDALARLLLAARRCGCRVRLRGASEPLRALLELCGLDGEFAWEPAERGEPGPR